MDDISKKSEPAVRRVVWGRQFLASTVVVPPAVAEHLNTDAMAVLAVIRNEAQASGKCSLPLARIAERANIGRAKARAAIRLAEGLGLIAIEEMPDQPCTPSRRMISMPTACCRRSSPNIGWLHMALCGKWNGTL